MSAPLVERIIAAHSGRGGVRPGQIVTAAVDRIYVQDGNSPTIARIFQQYGFTKVFDPARIGVFFDHSVLPPNVEMADRLREAEAFCQRFGLQLFRAGIGISHVVAQEEGWYQPGTVVLGSDSHTCTGGVLQCLALGMGASDVAAAMITGETWLRVPESVRIEVRGVPGPHTGAKDVLLHLLATRGQDPFLYRSVEWTGAWVEGLSSDSAATVAKLKREKILGSERRAEPQVAPRRYERDPFRGSLPCPAARAWCSASSAHWADSAAGPVPTWVSSSFKMRGTPTRLPYCPQASRPIDLPLSRRSLVS